MRLFGRTIVSLRQSAPFSSQEVLNQIPNMEYDAVQASCQAVIDLADHAGKEWSALQNKRPDAMWRIALGLRQMPKINEDGRIAPGGSDGKLRERSGAAIYRRGSWRGDIAGSGRHPRVPRCHRLRSGETLAQPL